MADQTDATKIKLSVAMAVLRNKPSGITGPEYAQRLADRIKARELQWRKRCHTAETEVLHLKQQLTLKKHWPVIGNQQDLSDTQKTDGIQ